MTTMWAKQWSAGRGLRMGALALAVAGALVACGGSGSDDAGQPLELTILHINDHHSTLEAKSKTLKL